MSRIIVIVFRVLFGSILAIATLLTTIIMSPIILLMWVRKKIAEISHKK